MTADGWDIQAPYEPGVPGHIDTIGDQDPGGSDRVAGTVDDAIAAAVARQADLAADTYGLGSTIGDLMDLPPVPDAASKHLGGPDSGYPA